MPCWMKKMPVDSSGSTKALDRPMATQLLTQELRLRPMRMRMWLAARSSRPGAAAARVPGAVDDVVQHVPHPARDRVVAQELGDPVGVEVVCVRELSALLAERRSAQGAVQGTREQRPVEHAGRALGLAQRRRDEAF